MAYGNGDKTGRQHWRPRNPIAVMPVHAHNCTPKAQCWATMLLRTICRPAFL